MYSVMLNIEFNINYPTIYLGNFNCRKDKIFYKHFSKPHYIRMIWPDQDKHLHSSCTGRKSMLRKKWTVVSRLFKKLKAGAVSNKGPYICQKYRCILTKIDSSKMSINPNCNLTRVLSKLNHHLRDVVEVRLTFLTQWMSKFSKAIPNSWPLHRPELLPDSFI